MPKPSSIRAPIDRGFVSLLWLWYTRLFYGDYRAVGCATIRGR